LHRKRKRIYELLVDDETLIKVGIESMWVWVAIELIANTILGIHIYLIKEACLSQNNLYNH
jgi:transposase-like protein